MLNRFAKINSLPLYSDQIVIFYNDIYYPALEKLYGIKYIQGLKTKNK